MNPPITHPTLSGPCEVTFGPVFTTEPLRGLCFAPSTATINGDELQLTLPPAECEFDTHVIPFATVTPHGPYLNFHDEGGGLLLTLAPWNKPEP